MAKEKYGLIPHDDKDVLGFKAEYGERVLEEMFLNTDNKSPKINNLGLQRLLKPNTIQFTTVDDIELIFNFHQYLQEKLTAKIKTTATKKTLLKILLNI